MSDKIQAYRLQHKERFLAELIEWLRIPSVSADSKYQGDVRRAAEFIADKFRVAGADRVEILETGGHPAVYAQKIVDPSFKTILVYGHYDVQPPDPLELWHSPPFEPVVKDDKLYARGACDDKGQVYMHVKAFETMVANEALHCNVKYIIEGEEEVGSANLDRFVYAHKELLACDVVLISDTAIISMDCPSINVGLRGLSYMEVEVTGPKLDLHSGVFGGAIANPANTLCKMIASLTNEQGVITIPGFYEDVAVVSQAERAAMNQAPFDLDEYKKYLDIADVQGEAGYTTLERTTIRPTLDVNGMWSGYTGEGAKTVLPSKAYAKISMRLVPNQDHHKISELFAKHFESIAPAGVKVKVTPHHGGPPCVTSLESPGYKAASQAMEKAFGKQPIPSRSGGSIPIVALLEKALDSDVILMGFGLDTDAIHSPNENFGLANFYIGIETIIYFFEAYAAQ